MVRWLAGWLVGWLVGLLVGRLVGWLLVACFASLPARLCLYSLNCMARAPSARANDRFSWFAFSENWLSYFFALFDCYLPT